MVLIAHGCGSHMAQHWFEVRGDAAVNQMDAYVGIGMGATDLVCTCPDLTGFDFYGIGADGLARRFIQCGAGFQVEITAVQ